ncbi:MAG TPA: HlyD family efflux transporter periplasmic adaptor subunit [Phenylobacterium sp.]
MDSPRLTLTALCVALLGLVLWLAWFLFGSVTLYEVSRQARLESGASAREVSALQAGRLVATHLEIGRQVHAGDVLAEFEAGPDVLRAREEEARLNAFPDKIAALRHEIEATQAAMDDDQRAAKASLQSAQARQREAAAGADFARDNERRMKAEGAAGGVAEVDALRATSEARKAASVAEALSADARKIDLDGRTRTRQSAAQIAELQRTLVSLEADAAGSKDTLERLNLQIEAHRVRAPVDGVVGEVMAARPGAYVAEGQKLATIVPAGRLVIVAQLDPATALGRIRPGQPARVRLDGYPWTQYGVLEARVVRVAGEGRDNGLQVELAPIANPRLAPFLRHGLTGRAEIAVEKVSPAVLLMRSAGQVSADAPPAAAAGPRTVS